MEDVIGIDLGTTNSCVAVVDGESRQVIPNKGGYKTTPSIVAITESGKRLVGQMAKRQAITNAEHTVYGAKRLIGRTWDSPAVQHCVETCSYEIIPGPHDDVRVRLRGEEYSMPEISSMVLQEMKLVAEEYLEEEPEKAVVTVPAYFNDSQRQATKDAGRIAGLDILRLVNEPTAAALAYGYGGEDREGRVAIYDLGGGTFDVSLLEISEGVFDVLSTAGDTFLGGEDFDARIIEHLSYAFAREHDVDLREDDMALQRLRDAAEEAKIELSSVEETEISLPFLYTRDDGEALHLRTSLTREQLDELVEDLIDRTLKICRATLEEANLETADVDTVILVGGMTRMPRVQQEVEEFFGQPPSKKVHPDEVVGVGAAIQGETLMDQDEEVLLLDVTPHSLGIMVHGGGYERLIEANSTIPTAESRIFTTVRDEQTSVKIVVLQGDSDVAEENELLGEFFLSGLREAPAGEVEIDVEFSIDSDGIVSVSATDLDTGMEQSITVTASSDLTEREVDRMVERNREYSMEVKRGEDLEQQRTDLQKTIREIEGLVSQIDDEQASDVLVEAKARATEAVDRAKASMESDDIEELEKLNEKLDRALEAFRGVFQQM